MIFYFFSRPALALVMLLFLACSSSSKAKEPPPDIEPTSKNESVKVVAPSKKIQESADAGVTSSQTIQMARGNRRRTGQSDQTGPRTPKLKWVFRTNDRIYADPVVAADGTIFVGSHDGHLYAVDRQGRKKWSFDAGGKIWSSPAIAEDGTIYFGSDTDTLYALNPDRSVKWTLNTTMPASKKGRKDPAGMWDVDTAPAIANDGTIYFGCHYFLYAIRPNGEVRWRFQAGTGRVKIFSSPAIGKDGHIYFGTQGNRFFALDSNSNALWNIETGKDNDSTPVVDKNGVIYFASDDGILRALSNQNGKTHWQTDLRTPIRAPLALSDDGTLFVPTFGPEPFICAINAKDGKEKWRFSTEPGEGAFFGIQSGVTIDKDGYLYFGGRDHYVYCLTPNGKLKWRYKTGDQVDTSPVLGPDGTLYIGSDDKRLYAFSDR